MSSSHEDQASEPLLTPNTSSLNKVRPESTLVLHAGGEGYTYAYGPKGLPGLLHNRYALACAVFASIGGFTFGYDQGVIANVLVMKDFLDRFPITPLQKGIMTAVLELGALFGALSAGTLADRFSRRHSILLACSVFCAGSLIQCAANSLNALIVGRGIGGLGVGALSMLSPLYMAEISPPELRGSLMALEQLAIVLGVVGGFWTGFATRNVHGSASWRTPLAIQIGPGVLLAAGSLMLPPSPRWLVLRGRTEAAARALAKLRHARPDEVESDSLVQIELLEMQVETELVRRTSLQGGKNHTTSVLGGWARLFSAELRDRTLIGVMIMFFQQWSGINALLYYGPTLVQSIGLKGDLVTLVVSGGIGIVQFIAVVPAILYIDRLGRRPLLRGGGALMCISHLAIALLIRQFEDDWESYPAAAWAAVGCVYMFTAAYGVSYGPVGWVLPSEVFPLSARSRGVALSTASNWINNFLIGLLTPELMAISSSGTFAVFACACFGAYLWATHAVPETGGIALEDMDAVFSGDAGKADAELRREIEDELGLTALVRAAVGER